MEAVVSDLEPAQRESLEVRSHSTKLAQEAVFQPIVVLQVELDRLLAEILSQVLFSKHSSRLALDGPHVFKVVFAIFFKANVIELLGNSAIKWVFRWIWLLSEVLGQR